MGKIPEKFKGS